MKTQIAYEDRITAYKAFDLNLQCRGFQFQLDSQVSHDGDVELCKSGFHACQAPSTVLEYHAPAKARFCVVEMWGWVDFGEDKLCSEHMKIVQELTLHDFLSKFDTCGESSNGDYSASSSNGDYSASSSNGYYSASSSNGIGSVSAAFGFESKAKGALGGAIVLVHRDVNGVITHLFASKVGENGVQPDAWYTLDDEGGLVECKN